MSEANRGRGQPRRGYRRTKPATRSGAGRLWSRRAAGFLLHTFLSPPKEKCERPIGLQALPSRRSRRVKPRGGQGFAPAGALGAFRSPPVPFGSPPEAIERPMGRPVPIRAGVGASFPTKGNFFGKVVACCCKQGGFPRGKQSARPALPCAPLVVCLNSGALTACGGCIHWMTVNFSNLI